ncbi:MAG: hypothetical protein L0K42_08475 [Acidipropionibacterium jensenii]|uniref:hypothetical protein n=2 Tax=Acidipropionibacterium jensenii TaxID=1749 RepID=UPI0026470831|nr:hypothetical protein [Acidipropionibacterium jensenii]MDN6480742.1 hypothetical protein [Acidipropionibacterium jensenii]
MASTVESRALHDLEKAGAHNVGTQVQSSDLTVDGARTTGLATGLQTIVEYSEVARGMSGGRMIVRSGRVPRTSSEVAFSKALDKKLGHPTRISVFSGARQLDVVGIFVDPYETDLLGVYGGPNLWQSLPSSIRGSFPQSSSSVMVSWDTLPIPDGASVLSRISGIPADSLMNGSNSRSFYLSASQRSLTQRTPGLFTYPSLGLMALAGIVMVGMLMPVFRAESGAITKLGVASRPILLGVLSAIAMLVVSAVVLGFLGGVMLGWLARLWVIPHLLTQPMSPFPPLGGVLLRLCVAALASALMSAAVMSMPRRGHRAARRARRWTRSWRRAVAVGAVAWCLYRLAVVHSIEDALVLGIVMTLAALLILPDAVQLVLRMPLPPSVNGTIAHRLARAQAARVTTVAMLLCGCLALPCSLTVLVSSVQVSNAAQALVPSGQLVLQDPSGEAPSAAMVRAVEKKSGVRGPVTVESIHGMVDGSASNCFGVMVVSSIDDLARLNDAPIDGAAAKTLKAGGVLDISGATSNLTLVPDKGRPTTLPTAHMEFRPAWAQKYAAAMLASTAAAMKLDLGKDAYVYTGVTDRQITLTKSAVFSAGGDPRVVNYHVDPEPPPIPWEWWLAVGALSVIALLATFVSTRALGADLRQHSAQFLAIGLPPATGRWVLASQLGVLTFTVVPLTIAVGILPTALVAAVNKGLELSVPTGVMALAAGVLVGAVAISGAGAMVGVTAKERTVDALV